MKHIVAIVIAVASSIACANTDIDLPANDPGNSSARSAPLPSIGASLAGDFDPLHREASTLQPNDAPTSNSPATHPHEHHHGAAPDQSSTGHEHAASEPSGKAKRSAPTTSAPTTSAPTTSAQSGHDTGDGPSKAVQKYTCPMHPEIIRDEPGNCPICGMKLVPSKKEDGAKTQ